MLASCASIKAAGAQSLANNELSESLLYQPHTLYNGWRKDVNVLTHFSGMFCPDYLGGLSRAGLVPDMRELGIGCIYEDQSGEITAIFRRHKPKSTPEVLMKFSKYYKQNHFPRQEAGIPENTVAFKTEASPINGRIEAMSAYAGTSADYTLWISISDHMAVGTIELVQADFRQLSRVIEKEQQ